MCQHQTAGDNIQSHVNLKAPCFLQKLASVVPRIYESLLYLDEHSTDVVRSILQDAPWIWVGTCFVACERIALR